MFSATVERPELASKANAADSLVDAARRVAHVSHAVRLLKSVAEDTIEDRVYATRRAMKAVRRRLDALGDVPAEAAHCIKQRPLAAVGVALGAGVIIGAVAGFVGSRLQPPD